MNSNRRLAENDKVPHLQLAEAALQRYALEGAQLTLISDQGCAIYKVSLPARGASSYHPYLGRTYGLQLILRIEDAGEYREATTYSELVLLATLLRDTDLALPEPVPAANGELVPELWIEGLDRPRQCVLFRWAGIRFPEEALSRASHWHSN